MSSSTHYADARRVRAFQDASRITAYCKREDEVMQVVIDWSDDLGTDTIASVAYDDDGVTSSSKSATTTTSTASFTGVGSCEITATLASGRKLQRVLRFYEAEGVKREDY